MGLLKKLTNKVRKRQRGYFTIMVKRDTYFAFKSLAIQQKMTHVDFIDEIIAVSLSCRKEGHEKIIADLETKNYVLMEVLRVYYKRFGKIYNSPADKTHIGSDVDLK